MLFNIIFSISLDFFFFKIFTDALMTPYKFELSHLLSDECLEAGKDYVIIEYQVSSDTFSHLKSVYGSPWWKFTYTTHQHDKDVSYIVVSSKLYVYQSIDFTGCRYHN